MYALVDANSFYCSAEQVFRPDWRGKPVIVLSNNDGCVVAANQQAKAAGVEKFKPFFQVKALCERHGVIACSSNYELYADLSAKMMQVIGGFAAKQHVYSIDETFLDLSGGSTLYGSYQALGENIRQTVWADCRLPVGVGVGATLTLAKAANHAAKNFSEFDGVCVISHESERLRVLQQMKIGDVWGIGRKLAPKLELMGITTALKLAQIAPKLARQQFSVEMERTVLELNGINTKQWDETRADKQQIFATRSVGERIIGLDSLMQAFTLHVSTACEKARKQGSVAGAILVFAHNSPYDEGQSAGFKQLLRLATPSNDSLHIAGVVASAIPKLFTRGVRYYKIGVGLIDLSPEQHKQLDLFNQSMDNPALMKALDGINQRFGRQTLFLAGQGIHPRWRMRRDLLTPQYTTMWRDIPKIRC